jgi:glycosyltransferase involved in cell wall biosynthesis
MCISMKNLSIKILFITYDGLTDSLGQSQILPYMCGLANAGYQVTILSCEKAQAFSLHSETIHKIISQAKINWEYITFTVKPPVMAKVYDLLRLRHKAIKLFKRERFEVIHCRSYVAANIGLYLKTKYNVKFIFDMRGLWPDERKDSGAWDTGKLFYRYLYHTYKAKEQRFIKAADYIIVLTVAVEREIRSWCLGLTPLKIQVISCCVDLQLFSLTDNEQKKFSRRLLQLSDSSLIISYLGSLGTCYMLDEMLRFFSLIKKNYPTAKFLFVTHSLSQLILDRIEQYHLNYDDIIIRSASREEVPLLMKASDISLSFIFPTYSKIASSPTKLGETMAMGIPVILNQGIGDTTALAKNGLTYLLPDFTLIELEKAVAAIPNLLEIAPNLIRQEVIPDYDLQNGIAKYLAVYGQALG